MKKLTTSVPQFETVLHNEPATNPLKLSEIIGHEIEQHFTNTFFDDENLNIDTQSVDFDKDVLQLIELSKQMQREFSRASNTGVVVSDEQHLELEGVRPSGSVAVDSNNHQTIFVPPLFLGGDQVMDEYYKDLVSEHFSRANRLVDDKKANKPIECQSKEIHKENPEIQSQSNLTSRSNKSRRIYPKVHSCLELSVAKPKKRETSKRSQSARAAYSARYYDFGQTHPNLELSKGDTLFPCRNLRSEVQEKQQVEPLNADDASFDLNDVECSKSDDENEEFKDDKQSIISNEHIVEIDETIHLNKLVDNTATTGNVVKTVDPQNDTWHNVLSSNSLILPTIANEQMSAANFADQPTQTTPHDEASEIDPQSTDR